MRKKIYINVILTALLTTFFSVSAGAQATKVKGRVTDSESGEGIPFAAVYFYGTTIGVSTDLEGYYSMETRDSTANTLCAALLGYETQMIRVSRRAFSEVDFRLHPVTSSLNAAVVKPDGPPAI